MIIPKLTKNRYCCTAVTQTENVCGCTTREFGNRHILLDGLAAHSQFVRCALQCSHHLQLLLLNPQTLRASIHERQLHATRGEWRS